MKTRGISCLAAIAILLTLTACAGPEITRKDVLGNSTDAEREEVAQADKASRCAIAATQWLSAFMAKMMRDVACLTRMNKKTWASTT